jgi:hypothetical protein
MIPDKGKPDESGFSVLADLFANLSIFFLVVSIGAFIALSPAGLAGKARSALQVASCDAGRSAFEALITYAGGQAGIEISHSDCATTFAFTNLNFQLGETDVPDSWHSQLAPFCSRAAQGLWDSRDGLGGYRLQFTGYADPNSELYTAFRDCLDRVETMPSGQLGRAQKRAELRSCLINIPGRNPLINQCRAAIAHRLSPDFLDAVDSVNRNRGPAERANRDRLACYTSNLIHECHALERARSFYHFCSTVERSEAVDGTDMWEVARLWQEVASFTSASTSPHPFLSNSGANEAERLRDDTCLATDGGNPENAPAVPEQRIVTLRVDYPIRLLSTPIASPAPGEGESVEDANATDAQGDAL